jgi:hypothetical protein
MGNRLHLEQRLRGCFLHPLPWDHSSRSETREHSHLECMPWI